MTEEVWGLRFEETQDGGPGPDQDGFSAPRGAAFSSLRRSQEKALERGARSALECERLAAAFARPACWPAPKEALQSAMKMLDVLPDFSCTRKLRRDQAPGSSKRRQAARTPKRFAPFGGRHRGGCCRRDACATIGGNGTSGIEPQTSNPKPQTSNLFIVRCGGFS